MLLYHLEVFFVKNLLFSIKALLLFVLLVSLTGAVVIAQPASQPNTENYWTINGCWISINAHANVDMGQVSDFSPGDILDNTGNNVEVKSNCQGYTVDVEATQFSLPTGHPDASGTAITDFAIQGGDYTSYQPFTGLNSSIEMATVSIPGKTDLSMDYQYTFDMNDVPGDYRVYLTYTASTL